MKSSYKEGDILSGFELTRVWIKHYPSGQRKAYGEFICKHCGELFTVNVAPIKSGKQKSCGCKTHEQLAEAARLHKMTHGLSDHPTYRLWIRIKTRCYNKNYHRYEDWGGRGITMFPPWVGDFTMFHIYVTALPNYQESLSLDRINNDGNYEPGNLRWATPIEQASNRRSTVILKSHA